MKNSGLPTGSGLRCCPSIRSRSTIRRNCGSSSQSSYIPSSREANRQTATTSRRPPGRRTRQASGGPAAGRPVGQVVQRTEQQHRVLRPAVAGAPARRQRGGEGGRRVAARRLESLSTCNATASTKMHPVSAPGQRGGVGAGPPPTSSSCAGGAGSSRSSNSIDLTNSSAGLPPGNNRARRSQCRNDSRSPGQSPSQPAAKPPPRLPRFGSIERPTRTVMPLTGSSEGWGL